MKRRRINSAMVCSSDHYRESRQAHLLSLELNHKQHEEYLIEIQNRVVVKVTVYTEVEICGKWIKLDGADPNSFKGFNLR